MGWYVGYDANNNNSRIRLGDSPSTPWLAGFTVTPVVYSGTAIAAGGKPNFRLVSWNSATLQFDDNNPVPTEPTIDNMGYQTWDGTYESFWF